MRSEQKVNRAVEQYADTVRRICLVHLKNHADTEDIFQTVFVKYLLHNAPFASPEHERAWIIRVTINACRDLLRNVFRRRTVPLTEAMEQPAPPEEYRAVLQAVQELPGAYRDVVYLHYYEGYTAPEIAGILGKNVNTVSGSPASGGPAGSAQAPADPAAGGGPGCCRLCGGIGVGLAVCHPYGTDQHRYQPLGGAGGQPV